MANTEKETEPWEKPTTSTGQEPKIKITEREPSEEEESEKQLVQEFLKELEGLTSGAREAKTGVEELGAAAKLAAEEVWRLTLAFNSLIDKVEKGVIKSFDDLEKAVDSLTGSMAEAIRDLDTSFGKIKGVLGTAAEDSKEFKKLKEAVAGAIEEKLVPLLETNYKKMEDLAKAAMGGEGPMGMRGTVNLLHDIVLPKHKKDFPAWIEKNKREIETRLSAAISAIEEQDKAFGESWRDTWPIETLLATIYTHSVDIDSPELREFQRELRQKYEDRRRIHDYFWMYQRSSGIDAILQMSAILPRSVVERRVRTPGVSQAMYKMQGMLEEWDKANRADRGTKEEKGRYKREHGGRSAEDMKKEWSEKIVTFGRGYKKVVEKVEGKMKEKIVDDPNGENNRIAGRLMAILGLTSQYMYTDFGGSGDFFIGRICNLRDHIMGEVRKGGRWQYRDKIMAGFQQHLYFSGPLAGGGLGKGPEKNEDLRKMGLEMVNDSIIEKGREVDHRILVKIMGEEGAGLMTGKFAIDGPEAFFGGGKWGDLANKADEGRKLFRNTGQFLDRPTPEFFFEMAKDFQHLTGQERREFFAHLVDGFIGFYKGEGNILSRLIGGKPLITDYEITDPSDPEGKKKISGISFASCDAERAGIDKGWNTHQMDFFVNKILKETDLLDPAYAEWIKRKNLGFLLLPGVGPVRGAREIWDLVYGNIVLALLAMILEMMKASLPEELGLGEERKKKR